MGCGQPPLTCSRCGLCGSNAPSLCLLLFVSARLAAAEEFVTMRSATRQLRKEEAKVAA